jgi:subtilisin family serine protease
MRNVLAAILWMTCLGLGVAHAQLVPPVQLPPVPLPPEKVSGMSLPQTSVTRNLDALAGARILRVESLAREHRAELERDPHGELVVRAEVVAIDITAAALKRALADDFRLQRTQELPDLDVKISVLQTPEGWSASRGLKRLRKLDPGGIYDFNHVYLDGGLVAESPQPARLSDAPSSPGAGTSAGLRRVGLIDGGVDAAHEDFRGVHIEPFGCGGKSVPSAHGTSVASVLVSHHALDTLYSADVYCGVPTGGAVDSVAAAFGWLARERVAVINVSLVGPRNALLERVVNALVSRGFIVVAAVGNDGPAAAPLYPAAYDGVIGVTAVDHHHRALVEACRGKQVDFAASGADIEAATQAPDLRAAVRGTSFAAPVVAGLLAENFSAPDPAQRAVELARWIARATDLGKPGRDEVYGDGELGSASSPYK